MHRSESFRKLVKICIVAFLCSEMQTSLTQMRGSHLSYASAVNGTEATLDNAKHHASIRLAASDGNFGEGHICSGAVIASSVVLTVASCLFNYDKKTPRHPAELKVVMGNLNRYQRTAHTLSYGVTHIYQPTTFDAETLRDNIAIVMLARDIPESHLAVQPIAFSTLDTDTLPQVERGIYEVTSWGATQQNVPFTQLLALNATKLSDHLCLQKYGPLFGVGMLCVGLANRQLEACPADAGAPLLHVNRLLGLVSYGEGCAQKTRPMVYTSVAYHSKWILDKIGDGSNQNSSIWGTLGFMCFTIFVLRRRLAKF